uniref:Histamine H1 receptor n=1 Tax=Neogobius melanostomus TaxID=47308 RepID=A0A8C6U6C4_9GOBI
MNLLVLYAVIREKSLHTVGNLYIVSLSVADLIVGTTVMPLNLVYLLEDEWKLGRAVCQFWLIMDYVASTASIFSVFILCLDRYRSVRQPLKYLKYRTRGKARVMISRAWLLSMAWIIPILGWRSFTHVELKPEDENKCDTDFRFVTWFKVITAIFNFYVPCILMLWRRSLKETLVSVPNSESGNKKLAMEGYKVEICNNCEVNHSSVPWREEGIRDEKLDVENEATLKQTWQKFIDNSRQRIQSLRIHKENKAAKQLGFIIVAFLLCWIPYFIAFMVMAFCKECVHHDLHMFTIWVFKNILNIH